MPYAQYDDSGNITGLYANLQPGVAEEYLEEDDPELVAYLEGVLNPPPQLTSLEQLAFSHENRIRVLEGLPPMSLDEFVAQIKGTPSGA